MPPAVLSSALASAPTPDCPWIERAPRRESTDLARLSGPTVAPFVSRIRNISASGMLVDMIHPLSIGDILTAVMPGGRETLCRVVRTKDGRAGLKFVTD